MLPDSELTYGFDYKSAHTKKRRYEIAGMDRYKVVFNWKYQWEEFTETQYKFIANDAQAPPPRVHMYQMQVFNRKLTEEEGAELAKKPIPKRQLK
jgi:hypothetical protein